MGKKATVWVACTGDHSPTTGATTSKSGKICLSEPTMEKGKWADYDTYRLSPGSNRWVGFCMDWLRKTLIHQDYRPGDVTEIELYDNPTKAQLASVTKGRAKKRKLYVFRNRLQRDWDWQGSGHYISLQRPTQRDGTWYAGQAREIPAGPVRRFLTGHLKVGEMESFELHLYDV